MDSETEMHFDERIQGRVGSLLAEWAADTIDRRLRMEYAPGTLPLGLATTEGVSLAMCGASDDTFEFATFHTLVDLEVDEVLAVAFIEELF